MNHAEHIEDALYHIRAAKESLTGHSSKSGGRKEQARTKLESAITLLKEAKVLTTEIGKR